jgi:hypothetical protein
MMGPQEIDLRLMKISGIEQVPMFIRLATGVRISHAAHSHAVAFSPGAPSARKDDAHAAVEAPLVNVAGLNSSSAGGG